MCITNGFSIQLAAGVDFRWPGCAKVGPRKAPPRLRPRFRLWRQAREGRQAPLAGGRQPGVDCLPIHPHLGSRVRQQRPPKRLPHPQIGFDADAGRHCVAGRDRQLPRGKCGKVDAGREPVTGICPVGYVDSGADLQSTENAARVARRVVDF